MKTTRRPGRRSHRPLVWSGLIALASTPAAHSASFTVGDWQGQFDSSLSIGASWSTSNPDRDLIGSANGGRGSSITGDDGRLNFRKGEAFSKIFKGIHDLELKNDDSGLFLRGKYWYDYALADDSHPLYDISDSGRKMAARSSGYELLDAFAYHDYSLAGMPGSVRLGKQVVSWGESVFIGNSINSINPIDVSSFRRPGAEIKEGLIPVNLLYLSQGLTDSLSAEAFYQLDWQPTVVDNCGTFFSTTDVVANGCERGLGAAGSDFDRDSRSYVYVPRGKDRDAHDSGQYGLALRWFAESLNDTEFGLYAMNYHSRNPYVSTTITTANPFTSPANGAGSASYFVTYPEDIHLYGLSFQTNVGSASLAGELSYRPNMPLQINTTDLLLTTYNLAPLVPTQVPSSHLAGDEVPGYERKPFTQAQVALTKFFDQVLGASRLTVVGEVGFDHIGDLGSAGGDDVRFGRDSVYGSGAYTQPSPLGSHVCQKVLNRQQPGNCNGDGFYTADSWGYRMRALLDYHDVFAGINLSPNLAWSQDVQGYGPNFNEGAKAVSIGLNADYLSNYTASISYTDFFGGDYNTLVDRDFLSVSFGINF